MKARDMAYDAWIPFGVLSHAPRYGAKFHLTGPNTWNDECSASLAGQVPFYRGSVLSWRRHSTGQTLLMTRTAKTRPIKHWDSDVRYAARKAAMRYGLI